MGAPLHNQAACTGVSTAVPLSAAVVDCSLFIVKAPATNNAAVFLGGATVTSSNGYQLDPGTELTYERSSLHGQNRYELRPSDFYVAGGSGDKVTWLASP